MELWFAALMGLVQGLTEFLPISSTAHLRIAPALLGKADPGAAFSAVIQLGTLAAVIAFFRRELVRLERRQVVNLVLGTVPIGVAGLLFKRLITGDARSLWVVAGALIMVAGVMLWADRAGKQSRLLGGISAVDALLIGLAQACALIPGVSRSGATISAALFLGLRRDDAARFSFLLSIPAIGAAGLFELKDALPSTAELLPLGVATVVAAATGYASIAWLLTWLRTRTLLPFAIYRFGLALVLIVLLVAGHQAEILGSGDTLQGRDHVEAGIVDLATTQSPHDGDQGHGQSP